MTLTSKDKEDSNKKVAELIAAVFWNKLILEATIIVIVFGFNILFGYRPSPTVVQEPCAIWSYISIR
jgi:hypothetical protein